MNRPTIVFIIESTSGGSKRHVVDSLGVLISKGYMCALYYSTLRQDVQFKAEMELLKERGVYCKEVVMRRELSASDFNIAYRISKDIHRWMRDISKNNPIVIHGHSSKGGLYARLCGIFLSVYGLKYKVVYTPHSPITMNPNLSTTKRIIYTLAERLLSHLTDNIIAVSDDEREHLLSIGLFKEKVKIIYNGIDSSGNSDYARNEKFSTSKLKLLFVGRLSEQKNPLYALEIVKYLEDATLTIVGDGSLTSKVEEFILKNQLGDRVRVVGFMSNTGYFYDTHDALIISSFYEGFPYVVLEAMARGCVIIGTDVLGVKGIIRNTNNILIPINDAPESAKLVRSQIEGKLLEKIDEQNVLCVREKYSLQQMVNKMENLYLNGW